MRIKSISTFSIVAFDNKETSWGIAVASKFLAVGAIVPYAKAGVGAIATQSSANASFGEEGLRLIAQGFSAQKTLEILIKNDKNREDRQVGIIDSNGQAATFTGKKCSSWAGGIKGINYAIQGNVLENEKVVAVMAKSFEKSLGELADRLLAALAAGDCEGGDRRGKQSAALLVVKPNGGYGGYSDRYIDLRVDDHIEPVQQLGVLLDLHHLFLGTSKAEDRIRIDKKLVCEFQALLNRLGFFKGGINGKLDVLTQKALAEFIDMENLEQRLDLSSGFIDAPALEYIRKKFEEDAD